MASRNDFKGIGIKVTLDKTDYGTVIQQFKTLIEELKKISEKNPINVTFDNEVLIKVTSQLAEIKKQMDSLNTTDGLSKELQNALKIGKQLEDVAESTQKVIEKTNKITGANQKTVVSELGTGITKTATTGTNNKGNPIDTESTVTNFKKIADEEEKISREVEGYLLAIDQQQQKVWDDNNRAYVQQMEQEKDYQVLFERDSILREQREEAEYEKRQQLSEKSLKYEQQTDRAIINERIKDLQQLEKELTKIEERFHNLQTQPNKKQGDINNIRNEINSAIDNTNNKNWSDDISGIAQKLEPLERSLNSWIQKDNKEVERRNALYEQLISLQGQIHKNELNLLSLDGEESNTVFQKLEAQKQKFAELKKEFNEIYNKDVANQLKTNQSDHEYEMQKKIAQLNGSTLQETQRIKQKLNNEDEQSSKKVYGDREKILQFEQKVRKAIADSEAKDSQRTTEQRERVLQAEQRIRRALEISQQKQSETDASTREKSLQYEQRVRTAIAKEQQTSTEKEASIREKVLQYEQKVRSAIAKEQEKKTDTSTKDLEDSVYKDAEASLKRQYQLREKLLSAGKLQEAEIRKQLADEEKLTQEVFKENEGHENTTKLLRDEQVQQLKLLQQQLNDNLQLKGQASQDGKNGLAGTLKSVFGNVAQWVVGGQAIMAVMNEIRNGLTFINDLNKSMTEIAIVTGKNKTQIDALAKSYNDLAKQMSVTTQEIAKASVEFYRQGLSDDQVRQRMETTTKYAKVSSLDFQESATILTATVNSMGVDINKASDVFSYLGDITATGADEVGRSFQRLGGTAHALGVEFEKVSSWIAEISSKTRESSEVIGTSLNAIMARYQNMKEKGFDEEDGTKVNDVAKALSVVGIKIMDTQGQFRNFGTVMDELGAKWNSLDTRQKSYISTTLAGTRQQARLNVSLLMQ